jgi:phospholipid/cholesterol/gamma-HCH transport system permease protein
LDDRCVPYRPRASRSRIHPPGEPHQEFRVTRADADGVVEVRLEGTFTFVEGSHLWRELRSCDDITPRDAVRFDLSGVDAIDGGAMALLVQTKWDLQQRGVRSEFTGGRGAVQKILELYHGEAKPDPRPRPKAVSTLAQIGQGTYDAIVEVQLVLAFLGDMVVSVGGVLRRPRTGNWHEIGSLMNRTGADAVPIVVLINFLLGFVMAFQSAVQLKQFGANIYVADLVGLSITRELGPLMTAIIVCGRSGAAFAAELGSMRVSEEVDALRTMGFGPLRFLVLPRMMALFLVMPVLTMLGDLVGMSGGLLVGITSLDLTTTGYLTETVKALRVWDVMQGVIKCGVFGAAIGLIACQQGLATTGGAEGVGRRTTSSVVLALFTLILIDAGFTMLFHELDL